MEVELLYDARKKFYNKMYIRACAYMYKGYSG